MQFRKPANVKGPRRSDAPRPTPGQLLEPEPRRELSVAEGQQLLRGLKKIALQKAVEHRLYMRGIESEQVYGHLANPDSLEAAVALAHGAREFPRYELLFRISKRKRFKLTGTLIGSELHVEAASVVTVA